MFYNVVTGGGGGVQSYFLGSEILAKRNFLGLRKTPEFFWVMKKGGIFWVLYLKLQAQFTACVGFFWVYKK